MFYITKIIVKIIVFEFLNDYILTVNEIIILKKFNNIFYTISNVKISNRKYD